MSKIYFQLWLMFDRIPDGVHFFEGQFIKTFTCFQRFGLHLCKPADEFLIVRSKAFSASIRKTCVIK